ncbi:hypothetical protein LO763_22710 [Glycomyces sp. A-F 0318]|uniref:hypothetical protein n=1 Tax=Glycomyces amatae TaxID=2881355 RepID=UPI001E3656CB|nr:hypothetical protein [Glycomyces amatae]MCD0446431.1 hypothetical protein [Glycomyces amatae]
MTDTTETSGDTLLDTAFFREELFPPTASARAADAASKAAVAPAAKKSAPARSSKAKKGTGSRPSRPSRTYDGEKKSLTYGSGERVPSRLGAVEWARDAVDWPRATTAVAVAMALALRLDETLVCWPGQERLAADVCSTSRSVRTALRDLEDKHVVGVLYLWRGKEPSGCVYVLNVDGWLDDVLEDRPALLRRVVEVRERAFAMELSIRDLPKETELSTEAPRNQHSKKLRHRHVRARVC